MNWKKSCLENFRLYAVTDLRAHDRQSERKIERALRGGVDIIQLRSKTLPDCSLIELGRFIRAATRRMHKLFIVNDRLDLALALDADGVHLGQEDMSIRLARKVLVDRAMLIGKSTHSVEQAVAAEREGADYIGFGPVFQTPTKPDYPPVGLNDIAQVARKIRIPFACIGGIDEHNVTEVLEAGARRVAVVRAIFSQPNILQATRTLREKINQCLQHVL